MNLKDSIRTLPDFPKPGILFRDVTSLMEDPVAFAESIRQMAAPWADSPPDYIVGIEARGFIFGAALAVALGAGFIPLRKPGKLPGETLSKSYALEYGNDALHLHVGAITPGKTCLLIDDLIATGGTAMAGSILIERAGGKLIGAGFLVDLPDLGGADKLREQGLRVESVMTFAGH